MWTVPGSDIKNARLPADVGQSMKPGIRISMPE
ncbi:Uncharacterised protein [Burkholderia oklahomensis]|nr:hypothetical protein BG90_1355 [Burkholderia oklahomensis C6786]SUW59227.1 Uncharacterised protein [Burkholderia oklahomensis]